MRRTLRGLISAPTGPFSEYAPTVATIKPGFAEPPGDSKANALQHLIPATCQPSETAFRANAHQRFLAAWGARAHDQANRDRRDHALRVVICNHRLRERKPFVPALCHALRIRSAANIETVFASFQTVGRTGDVRKVPVPDIPFH